MKLKIDVYSEITFWLTADTNKTFYAKIMTFSRNSLNILGLLKKATPFKVSNDDKADIC